MIATLSWRNIWRNKVRSLVVIGSIVIGVWSVIFLMGMMGGMMNSYVDSAIKNEVSHIQIHHPKFPIEKENKYFIDDVLPLLQSIEEHPGVKAVSKRSITQAMISSSRSSRGIRVSGIVPNKEIQVTGMHEKIEEGTYLKDDLKNRILISQRTADKLKVKIKSKIVLTFQDLEGNITSGAFRIQGIFRSGNNMYDESVVFVLQRDLNKLLGKTGIAHELAIIVNHLDELDVINGDLKDKNHSLLVQSYKEIAPELELFQSSIKIAAYIYMVIFMLALIFGIINTMLMAVLERYKELGMLMAVGMNKIKVFFMIMIETIYLGLIGTPIGLLLGYLTTLYFNRHGLNLFFFSKEGMEQFGMSRFVYPEVEGSLYLLLALAVAITAFLAAIYPAFKAIRLKPVEAIRRL
jgi:ABC-type lipoprotein release transport system permease subunit